MISVGLKLRRYEPFCAVGIDTGGHQNSFPIRLHFLAIAWLINSTVNPTTACYIIRFFWQFIATQVTNSLWGVTTSNSGTITFPLAHKSSVFAVTLYTHQLYTYTQTSISLDNFVITSAIPQSQFQSFAKAYWISLGV